MALNRESGFGLDVVPDANESTFMMGVPPAGDDTQPPAEMEDDDDDENEPFAIDFAEEFAQAEPEAYDNVPQPEDMTHGEGMTHAEDITHAEDEAHTEDITTPEAEEPTELVSEIQRRSVKKRKRGPQLSQFGIEYPPLPPTVVKRLAQAFAQTSGISQTNITPETLDALCQASDWFFEQLGDSLRAYAQHAGRKTIDESDVVTLMQRSVSPLRATVVVYREMINDLV